MKKLLFVVSQLYKGGAETALVNLLNTIDHNNYTVELIVLNQCPADNATSLIDKIDAHVNVCDAYKRYQSITPLDRIRAKLEYSMEQKGAFLFPALDFVKNKVYDWAFFWGEWCAPTFVANYVNAEKKAAWIHSDIAKAEFFDKETYFYFYEKFDYFIFVSQKSMESAIEEFPFIAGKEVLIYNINNVAEIRKQSTYPMEDFVRPEGKKVLLTCANFRPEKNHFRQIAVLRELKERGIDICWVNIGSTTDKELVYQIEEHCKSSGVDEDFIILGPKENPYNYMKCADAVAVLSDHESWSMVITEAKILGVPVIATRTSGALEQIEDGKTGILVEFNAKRIADVIEKYFKNEDKMEVIRQNIVNFDNTNEIMRSFYDLIDKTPFSDSKNNSLLYIIDDVNYMGGAHMATFNQIRELAKEEVLDITIFTTKMPSVEVRKRVPQVKFVSFQNIRLYQIYKSEILNCLYRSEYSLDEKQMKLKLFYADRIKKEKDIISNWIIPNTSDFFSNYDIICVMSEGSVFRRAAALSKCKKKIQWIHTDYCSWRNITDWTRSITEHDEEIYREVDNIVVLSEGIKKKIATLYPSLTDKIIVNRNVMPVAEIKKKAERPVRNTKKVNFVTVGRMDNHSKACFRLLQILMELAEEGYLFHWTFIGNGEDYARVCDLVNNSILKEYVTLKGEMKNPFYEMKKADIFALLSTYEGLPNTIYEALILGLPVLATNVGGISDQIEDGKNGWLVANDKKEIKSIITYLLMNQEEIEVKKKQVENYVYNNDTIISINNSIFSLGDDR